MPGPENIREYCESAVVEWITENAGVRKERIVKTRRFTEEPVNMSVVKVLNMMDELVKAYNAAYGANIVLSQNWRLAHPSTRSEISSRPSSRWSAPKTWAVSRKPESPDFT